jgi:hypothetical protein
MSGSKLVFNVSAWEAPSPAPAYGLVRRTAAELAKTDWQGDFFAGSRERANTQRHSQTGLAGGTVNNLRSRGVGERARG